MKICKSCDKTYFDEYEFCPKCGGSLIDDTRLRCPKCKKVLDDEFMFCPYCGSELGNNEELSGLSLSDISSFKLLCNRLYECLNTLSSREKEVMEVRFGLKDGRVRTLEEVAQHFGVTRERIRQIEAKAFRRLKNKGMTVDEFHQFLEMLGKNPNLIEKMKEESRNNDDGVIVDVKEKGYKDDNEGIVADPEKELRLGIESDKNENYGVAYGHFGKAISLGNKEALIWYIGSPKSKLLEGDDINKIKSNVDTALDYEADFKFEETFQQMCKIAKHLESTGIFEQCFSSCSSYNEYFKVAFRLRECAAKHGSTEAFSEIGYTYENGYGVDKDYHKAFTYYEKAANCGHLDSMYHLGEMYLDGKGVEKDIKKAKKWIQKAAEQGHAEAKDTLNDLNSGKYSSVIEIIKEEPEKIIKFENESKSNDSEQEQLEKPNEEPENEPVIKSDFVLNKDRHEKLKSYLESFNRTEKDWVKWMINFVEVVSILTNYKIDDEVIITFYLYSESILTGCKPNVISGRLLLVNDYGRLLIGLMSKVDALDCLTNEEKRMFAWCIIGSSCSEDDKFETRISMCTSVNNVVSKYKDYGKCYFETLDNYPRYDNNEPLGTIRNPVTVIIPKDSTTYINQLEFDKNNSWDAYCHFDSIVKEEHTKGLFNEHNLTLYKIDVVHFNYRMSCVKTRSKLYLYINEAGMKISDNPPTPMYIDSYVNEGKHSYKKLCFKQSNNSIELSKIGATFSEFSLQFARSPQTWHDCGLKTPSEFGSINSFFSSKQNLIKRAFLEEEFHALATGILVRGLVDFFPNLLSQAEYFANMILGFQFKMLGKSDDESFNRTQLSLKKYLYENLTDLEIFNNNANRWGLDLKNDKQLLNAVGKLMDYCYKEIHSFLKEHSHSKIINDLS